MTDSTATDGSRPIAVKYKIILYVAVWLAALIATNPSGAFWTLAYMFPLGLAAFINRQWGNDGGWGVYAACVGIYLVHAYFYFRSREKRSTFILLGALVVLLVCNVSGCRTMLPGH